MRAEQKLSKRVERKMCVRMLNRKRADRRREKEREREVCARAGKARPRAVVPEILGD